MIALYDGEIANADRQIGALLDEVKALGLLEKTIIIFLSEHGDMMGKHGRFMRGGPLRGTFYDDVIRVPLLIRHPGLGPSRIGGLAQVVDLAPTILDMLGLPRPDGFAGKSLRPLILDGAAVNARIFAGSAYSPKKTSAYFRDASVVVAVRDLEWKLIRERLYLEGGPQDSYELFNVGRDPDELENVAPANPAAVADLERLIEGWLRDIGASDVIEELAR
jgi:arylsulfatase A-like enzyme